jgi:hypothetical protein
MILVDRPKSQEAISADISFVSAGKRRDFCRLRRREAISADISYIRLVACFR